MTQDSFGAEPATPDVYESVLGIPASVRPPNHYDLIGAQLFESDIKTLATTADAQIMRLRKSRPESKTMQKLYYELNLARAVLTNPATKAGYDQQLRQVFRDTLRAQQTTAMKPVAAPTERSVEDAAAAAEPFVAEPFAAHDEPFMPVVNRERRRRGPGSMLAVVGVNAFIAVVALAYFGQNDAERPKPEPLPKPAAPPPVTYRAPRTARLPRPAAPPVQQAEQPAPLTVATTTTSEPVAEVKEAAFDTASRLLPVPSSDEQGPLLERLQEVYGDELDSVRKSQTQLRTKRLAALAETIFQQAEKEKDPQWQFAVFSVAQMVAIESRNLPMSLKVLDSVCSRYDVDEMGQRWAVLDRICSKSPDPGRWEILRSFAQHCIAYERYDLAFHAMEVLKAGQPERLSPFDRVEFDLLKNFAAASNTLQGDPFSPAPLHDAGLFYVFIAHQHHDGFHALALDHDPALSKLAALELAASGVDALMRQPVMAQSFPGLVESVEPLMQEHYLRLGRAWREYGQHAQEKSIYRLVSYDRARGWIQRASSLKGADRIEAEKFVSAWNEDRAKLDKHLHSLPHSKTREPVGSNDLKNDEIQLANQQLNKKPRSREEQARAYVTMRAQENARQRDFYLYGEQPSVADPQHKNGQQQGTAAAHTGHVAVQTSAATGPSYSMSHANMTPQEQVIARAMHRAEARPMLLQWEAMNQPVFVVDPFGGMGHLFGHHGGHNGGHPGLEHHMGGPAHHGGHK